MNPKINAKYLATTFFAASALVLSFQNCSPNNFAAGDSSSEISLQSISESGTGVDLITPRIVLSDRMNGPAMDTFSARKTIYGTVYGLSADAKNLQVCIGVDNYCVSQPKDIWNYNRRVETLPTWSYNAATKTWHFTMDYSEVGDMIQKVSIHDLSTKEFTGVDFGKLHLERYFRVLSPAQDAAIYFGVFSRMSLFGSGGKPGNVFRFGDSIQIKLAGLGKDGVLVCHEYNSPGSCKNESNWMAAGTMGYVYDEFDKALKGGAGALSTEPGPHKIFAKSTVTNAVAEGVVTVGDRNITCAMRSKTPVFGPCSDPESSQACSQATVGQTAQGTGSCKVSYTCTCE
ncbi:MAG: hypothetical protein HUU57_07695 [Bdellovibrio sp.]|nr:hypothetical protein [Bdellovibrio sp.]